MLSAAASVLSFLTIFPAGGRGLGGAARHMYAFPAAGALIGAAAGLPAFGLSELGAEPLLVGLAAAAFLAVATGMHHTDGLADAADGLMAGGGRARRLAAMRDPSTGAAGTASLVLYFGGMAAALSTVRGAELLAALVAAEAAAKLSMVAVAAAGRPAAPGTGAMFASAMSGWRRPAASAAIAAAIAGAAAGPAGLAMLAAAVGSALALTALAGRAFGGVTGDVMGAANELGRLAAVLAFVSA